MKTLLIILVTLLAIVIAYWVNQFHIALMISKRLTEEAVPFQKPSDDPGIAMLVLGDSTAVGVGASTPKESVAGRAAIAIRAHSVENYAVSGAVVADLPAQIARAKRADYDLILIQIGANDIVRLHSPGKTADALGAILKTLPKATRVILISAGNVGGSTIVPPLLRPLYTHETLAYHDAFTAMAAAIGITYVNLYTAPGYELIAEHPDVYLAADGFHPSSAGYLLWYTAIQSALPR